MSALRSKNKTHFHLSKEEEKLSANMHFPYLRYADRKIAETRNSLTTIVMRGVHYRGEYGYMFKPVSYTHLRAHET